MAAATMDGHDTRKGRPARSGRAGAALGLTVGVSRAGQALRASARVPTPFVSPSQIHRQAVEVGE